MKLKVSRLKIIGWSLCRLFLIGSVGDGQVPGRDSSSNLKWCINRVEVFELRNGCSFWDWSRGAGKKPHLYNWQIGIKKFLAAWSSLLHFLQSSVSRVAHKRGLVWTMHVYVVIGPLRRFGQWHLNVIIHKRAKLKLSFVRYDLRNFQALQG